MSATEELKAAILSQNPTDQQRDAIFTDELEFLLRAAPGSGKTWTSCRRFIWRGANWPYLVGGLALLSFTNVAIHEFKEAAISVGRRNLLRDPNYIGTFDSFVERYILAPFGHLITGISKRPKLFPGPRPGDRSNNKLKAWIDGNGNQKIPVPAWDIIPYPDDTKVRFKTLRGVKVQGAAAIRELMLLGFYTHAQRVFWACKLLFDRPHIAELLAKRFPEIIVDEAQDTNAWLLILLDYLRKKGAKITLIGDPDQCIFEFSMADATSLPSLKEKWAISEKPLSQSFRCNNQIAAAARNIGGNKAFTGCRDGANAMHQAFIVKESSKSFTDGISALQQLTKQGALDLASATIVCRAHGQLESVRGQANYAKLKGKSKELAIAAFRRDSYHNYHDAFQTVERIIREITGDDSLWDRIADAPDAAEANVVKLAIWRFVKSTARLPSVSQIGNEWILCLRKQLAILIDEIGVKCEVKLGHHIKKAKLANDQMALPLFEVQNKFPVVRQDTIHQVKGESIDSVLVIGSTKFWNSVVKAVIDGKNSEDRRLAYVAMTRARHQLIIALPEGHFDKHIKKWIAWGFVIFKS